MRVELVENHTYLVNGDIASLSVTQLMKKHGLSPSYANVDIIKLNESAKYGTEVHRDIEIFVKNQDWIPETNEGYDFKVWYEQNVQEALAELPIGYDYKGMLIGGTCDILGNLKSGKRFIADHKTTTAIHRESVRWQLSLLDYFYRKFSKGLLNGMEFEWQGAEVFYCFHYKDGKLQNVIELQPIADTEIEKLLEAEYNNEKYEKTTLIITEELKMQIDRVECLLYEMQKEQEEIKKKATELRETLKAEMKRQGVVKFETDRVKISYKGEHKRASVNSRKLKEEYPFIYAKCVDQIDVKDSVEIKIKKETD